MEELRANPTSSISVKSKSELFFFKLISFSVGRVRVFNVDDHSKVKTQREIKKAGSARSSLLKVKYDYITSLISVLKGTAIVPRHHTGKVKFLTLKLK